MKRCSLVFSLTLFASGLSLRASADDITALLDLWRVDELVASAQQECRNATEEILTDELRLDEQRRRYRISPDDIDWHRLLQIYEEFFVNACAYVSIDEQRKLYRNLLEERFAPDEIHQLVVFYGSALGKKVVGLELDANTAVQHLIAERHVGQVVKAQRIFEERLAALLRERARRGRDSMKRTNSALGRLNSHKR